MMIFHPQDLSTSHVTQATMQQIEETGDQQRLGNRGPYGWPAMSIGVYEYGAFLSVPARDELDKLPIDLAAVMRFALLMNASVVRLDNNGDELPGLQRYEWGFDESDESHVLRLRDAALEQYGHSDRIAVEDDALVEMCPNGGAWVTAKVRVNED
jgi:hypothetical protein